MKKFKHLLLSVVLVAISAYVYSQQWQDVTPAGFVHGIYSNSFLNNNQGWLCARDSSQSNSAMILHTSNACLDWDTCYTFQGGMHFARIQMIDCLIGYGAGGYELPVFRRTTDGGHTWQDITDPILMQNGGPLDQSTAFFFVSADTGFYGGVHSLYRTVNGGLSWSKVEIPPDALPSTPEMSEYRINEIYFSGSKCGWASGIGWYSCILKTTDGGQTWQLAHTGGSGTYRSLHFINCNRGGFLVNTSYTPYFVATPDNFDSVYYHSFYGIPFTPMALCFQNDSVVWVGGWPEGLILRSTDSGLTFDTINPNGISPYDFGVSSITFFENTGYAIGSHVFKYIDTLNTAIHQIPFAENKLSIYPNPSSGKINLNLISQKSETAELRIYATDGRCVWKKSERILAGENKFHYSFDWLKPGSYMMEIAGARYITSQKFILRR